MSKVETSVSSAVLSVASDALKTRQYDYYYLYAESPIRAFLVQSDAPIENGAITAAFVTEYNFVHDDDDHLTDWRQITYPAAVFFVDNSESYIVYTNMIDGYPVLRNEVQYETTAYIAGFGLLSAALTCAVFMFRVFRINHS